MKNIFNKIWTNKKFALVTLTSILLLVSLIIYSTTFAATAPIDLSVTNASFGTIEADCGSGSHVLQVRNGGSAMEASDGNRFGYGTCTVTFFYNDQDTDADITLEKIQNYNLRDLALNDINDVGNGADCTIDETGNDNVDEEVGFRIDTFNFTSGWSVATDTACSKTYTQKSCGGGADTCYFDIAYGAETIVSGTSATCFATDNCYFTLKVAANITYDTEPKNNAIDQGIYQYFTNPPAVNYELAVDLNTSP